MKDITTNLFNLDELSGYKVVENYSDVRGWLVKDANNRVIGKVEHLLVNKSAQRVVYLDVEVDETLIVEWKQTYQNQAIEDVYECFNQDGENHLLIPIGMADIDKENKTVITNQIDWSTFTQAKRFKKGALIDFEYELNSFRHYSRDNPTVSSNKGNAFYDRVEFNNSFLQRDLDWNQ